MTKINKLVLRGFKSFARHTEMNFGDRFNVILGPNGSGKSNVLDALTFVLGKGSSKAMRAEKSSNLIYNGGKSKTPAKEAEVSIYFDNAKQIFPTTESEVKVTRIVKVNGQSVYKINNQRRTRQQILDLLAMGKIDPDGYNIILQGDVIKLIDMSGPERRTVVEEVAGISVYEDKKQKAVGQLDKVDEKLKEAEIILAERSAYLKELKKERDQALEYKEISDSLDKYKAAHLSKKIEKRQKEKEEKEARVAGYDEKIAVVEKKINELKASIQAHQQRISEINKEIEQKGEVEQVQLNKQIEELKIQITKKKTTVENNKTEVEKVKHRLSDLKVNLEETGDKIKRLEQERDLTNSELQSNKRQLDDIEQTIAEFKKKKKIGEDATHLETDIDAIDKNADEKQKEISQLREKQQNLLRERDRMELQIQHLDERIDRILSVQKENSGQIKELQDKRELFKKVTFELNKCISEDSSLSQQIGQSRSRLMEAHEELAKLRARNAGIREMQGKDLAIKAILERKNEVRGIHGTVSELGKVSAKYSIALGIAAGGRINSIVVDDDRVAAECIKFLQERKIGVATFLPLNKIKTRTITPETRALKDKPGVHGFAIDLVSHDAQYKNVFLHVFSNTLVVDDLQAARAIGVGTTRMITIAGDVVEMSGAMIGGYRNKRRMGGFKEKEVEKDLGEYEKTAEKMASTISKLEKEKIANEESIVVLRERKAHLEGEIIKMEKSMHMEHGDDLKECETLKKKLQADLGESEKHVNDILRLITDINTNLAKEKMRKSQLKEKLSEMRNPKVLAELNAFEAKRTELREKHIKLEADSKSVVTQLESMVRPEYDNIERIMKQHHRDLDNFSEESTTLVEQIEHEEKDLVEKEKQAKAFYAQFKQLFSEREEKEKAVRKDEKNIDEHDITIKGVQQKTTAINIEKARVIAELAGLEKEFEPFQSIDHSDVTLSAEELRKEIVRMETKLAGVGAVNMRALEIYEEVEKEYNNVLEKKQLLHDEKTDIETLMAEIDEQKKEIFMKTYNHITDRFKTIFSSLSRKGQAYLELDAPDNPFDGGLNIKVKLSSKKFMDLKSLSGGEKTMTALAFIFAVQEFEPASFYVLDEVDAALDKKNSELLGKLINQYAQNSQYVVISHNDSIIGEAEDLFGISMNEHGMSNVTTLKL